MEEQTTRIKRPELISLLWIFLSLNYILCDVLSNMEASTLQGLMTGNIAGIEMNQGFLLAAGISLELPIAMVVLSRVTPYRVNRILNISIGLLMIVYQLGSFFVGTAPSMHYIFFSVIEVAANALIVGLAITWKSYESLKKGALA